jgi:hypothetical protein
MAEFVLSRPGSFLVRANGADVQGCPGHPFLLLPSEIPSRIVTEIKVRSVEVTNSVMVLVHQRGACILAHPGWSRVK